MGLLSNLGQPTAAPLKMDILKSGFPVPDGRQSDAEVMAAQKAYIATCRARATYNWLSGKKAKKRAAPRWCCLPLTGSTHS